MNDTWASNNVLREEELKGNIIKVDCSFKEFVNSPFFEEFAHLNEKKDLIFKTETDKLKISWIEEFFDSWGVVKFYFNGSKSPNAQTVAENIEGVTLLLDLDEYEKSLEKNVIYFDNVHAENKEYVYNSSICFCLDENMWQKLVDAYKDYYDDYFPGMIHEWEGEKMEESHNIPRKTEMPSITELIANDMKAELNKYSRFSYVSHGDYLNRCEIVNPLYWHKANVVFVFNNSHHELTRLLNMATDILRSWNAKYIGKRYNQVYCRLDLNKYEDRAKEIKKKADAERDAAIDAVDISKYKPSQKVIIKLEDYRNRNSKVNVNAIKDPIKYLTYYYGACLMGWKDLKNAIEWKSDFSWDYRDELIAIDKKVKSE